MKTQNEILIENGFTPAFSNAIFNEREPGMIIGSVSEERGKFGLYAALCMTIEENEITDFDKMVIGKNTFKKMCLTADLIITDFGIDIHSHDLKTSEPYCKIKLVKIKNW